MCLDSYKNTLPLSKLFVYATRYLAANKQSLSYSAPIIHENPVKHENALPASRDTHKRPTYIPETRGISQMNDWVVFTPCKSLDWNPISLIASWHEAAEETRMAQAVVAMGVLRALRLDCIGTRALGACRRNGGGGPGVGVFPAPAKLGGILFPRRCFGGGGVGLCRGVCRHRPLCLVSSACHLEGTSRRIRNRNR